MVNDSTCKNLTIVITLFTICFAASCSPSVEQELKPMPTVSTDSEKEEAELAREQLDALEKEIDQTIAEIVEANPERDEKEIKECKKRLRDKVTLAKKLFNSKGSEHYRDTKWLNDTMTSARNEYDACIAAAG